MTVPNPTRKRALNGAPRPSGNAGATKNPNSSAPPTETPSESADVVPFSPSRPISVPAPEAPGPRTPLDRAGNSALHLVDYGVAGVDCQQGPRPDPPASPHLSRSR